MDWGIGEIGFKQCNYKHGAGIDPSYFDCLQTLLFFPLNCSTEERASLKLTRILFSFHFSRELICKISMQKQEAAYFS